MKCLCKYEGDFLEVKNYIGSSYVEILYTNKIKLRATSIDIFICPNCGLLYSTIEESIKNDILKK